MLLGESYAARRRIGPLYAADETGAPVLGEDFSGTNELLLTVGGDAFVVPAGSIGEIGDGYYYYEATLSDASVGPWIAIKIGGVCQEFELREDVASQIGGILAGTTDSELLQIGPLPFFDSTGAELGSGDVGSVTTEISINGSAWDAATGALTLTDDGYLYYVANPLDVVEPGWIAVKITGPCQEIVFREDVVSFAISNSVPPEVVVVSPTPGVAPGDPGGFPKNYDLAKNTPIVLEITDLFPGVQYLVVIARFYMTSESPNPVEEVVFRRGQFRGLYIKYSYLESIGDGVRLHTRRYGGWPTNSDGVMGHILFAVDALDASGNLAP